MTLDEALSGEAGLPGIRWILSGRPARTLLRTELATMLGDAGALGPCRVSRLKFRPGRELRAYLDISLNGSLPTTRLASVSWKPEKKYSPLPAERTEAATLEYSAAAPFRRLSAESPEWGMQLTVAPFDPTFPELGRLADPRCAAEVLEQRRGAPAVTLLRYFPGSRHVLRYDPPSAESIFLKIDSDGVRERVLAVGEAAREWLGANGSPHDVVRTSALAGHDRVVVAPGVAGWPLSRALGKPTAARKLRDVGALLHLLQRAPLDGVNGPEPHGFGDQLAIIRRAGRHIAPLDPPAGRTFDALLQRTEGIYAQMPQEPPALVHGDFKADHLFVSRNKFSLLDLDNCRLADPALDAGKMLADLHWWYEMRGRHGEDAARQAFLDGYLGSDDRMMARARLWEVLFLAKLAARRVQLFRRDWASTVQTVLAEAGSRLTLVEVTARKR